MVKKFMYADELYPVFFIAESPGWEREVDFPEDFDLKDYYATVEKWDAYQDKLEELFNSKRCE